MLKKIDCIMIRVDDVEAAASHYAEVFGLHRRWSDEGSIGLAFEESDTEVVLHRDLNIPSSVEVHYLVDNVITAVTEFAAQWMRSARHSFRYYNWKMCGNQRSVRHPALHPRYDEGSSSSEPYVIAIRAVKECKKKLSKPVCFGWLQGAVEHQFYASG